MSEELWEGVERPAPGKVAYVEKYATGDSLLDIGCAQGWYAKLAQDKGMDVLGTDLKNFMAIDTVPFEQIQFNQIIPDSQKSFDTVLMFDVLEHVTDEDQALSDLREVCNKRVILLVPNKDDSVLPRYNLTLVNRRDLTHQGYYTPEYLEKRLGEYGFKIIHMSYEGAILPGLLGEFIRPTFIGTLISKLLNKLLFVGLLKTPAWGDIYVVADKVQYGSKS